MLAMSLSERFLIVLLLRSAWLDNNDGLDFCVQSAKMSESDALEMLLLDQRV